MSALLTAVPIAATASYAEARDPFLFRRVRTWWLLLALFIMATANGTLVMQPAHTTVKFVRELEDPPRILLLVTVVMWVICIGLMVKQIGLILRMMLKQKAVLAFAVLALLSTLWSPVPQLTFRKATILFLYLLFAWFFATYYTPPDQMRLLLALGAIMALASILWSILLPQYGIAASGEWKGVFGHKNALGGSMFYLFAGLPFCRISSGRRLLTVALQAILPLGLILLSQSRTPLIMMVVLIAVRVLGPLMARTRRERIPFILYCVGFCIAMIPTTLAVILPLLGRDLTLTGRTHSWAVIFPFALKALWLGHGYQGFWHGASGDAGIIDSVLGAGMTGADNGYLEVMLELGLVGMGLLFLLMIVCIRDFLRLLRKPSVPLIAYWYTGLILATFVGGITENLFFMPIRFIPFVFALACAGLRRLSDESAETIVSSSGALEGWS